MATRPLCIWLTSALLPVSAGVVHAAPKYVWEGSASSSGFDARISNSDLINGLPAGSILLNTDLSTDYPFNTNGYVPINNNGDGCAPTPINSPNTGITGFHPGVHPDPIAQKVKLVDGLPGINTDSVLTDFAWPAAVFQFDLASPASIGEIRVFAANSAQDGRVFQDYDVEISTDLNPTTRNRVFTPLIQQVISANYVCAGPGTGDGFNPNNNNANSVNRIGATMTRVFDDANPVLAASVTSIRFTFYPVDNTQGVFWDRWLGKNGCAGLLCNQVDPQDQDGFKRPFVAPVIKEIDVLPTRDVFEICNNGIDDDGDALVDAADPDCFGHSCPPENCTNGIDDNGDGCVDCDDPDCASQSVCHPEICTNGIDDDGDNLVDCLDPDCAADLACLCHNPVFDLDNDGDVDVDDFGRFQRCYTGPAGGSLQGECVCIDLNHDGSIDEEDFARFQLCASGANIPADANCDN